MITIVREYLNQAILWSSDESAIPVWYAPPYGSFEVIRQEINFSGPTPVLTLEVKQI